jgi:glycerophosphoryl diester phosphodiesterase
MNSTTSSIQIIAHRGFWIDPTEKNTAIAFIRAFESGFGVETDFRDMNGELVISHDIPITGVMSIDDFIKLYTDYKVIAPIALNIKSDGLYYLMESLIKKSGMTNYFVFDMSVPDMIGYISKKIPIFSRLSEYETHPVFLDQSQGIWLDAFESQWYNMSLLQSLLDLNKKIAIVSPELHNRNHMNLWNFIKQNGLHKNSQISICTDFPLHARKFFFD